MKSVVESLKSNGKGRLWLCSSLIDGQQMELTVNANFDFGCERRLELIDRIRELMMFALARELPTLEAGNEVTTSHQ